MADVLVLAIFGLLFFVGMWLAVLNLLWRMGGWKTLESSYRALGRPTGESFNFRSASFGVVNYGNCLRLVSGHWGLYLEVSPLFRVGHNALSIPWEDLTIRVTQGWVFQYVDFRTVKHPQIRIRMRPGLARRLLSAAGQDSRLPMGI